MFVAEIICILDKNQNSTKIKKIRIKSNHNFFKINIYVKVLDLKPYIVEALLIAKRSLALCRQENGPAALLSTPRRLSRSFSKC